MKKRFMIQSSILLYLMGILALSSLPLGKMVTIQLGGLPLKGARSDLGDHQIDPTAFGINMAYQPCLNATARVGANMSRFFCFWWCIEQPTNTTWDFSMGDAYVQDGLQNNLTMFGLLSCAPSWVPNYTEITNETLPLWLNYVNVTVTRYKAWVKAWEIHNEPDMPDYWSGSLIQFYHIQKEAAKVIKAIDPTLTVISAASAYNKPDYLENMIAFTGEQVFNQLFDAVAVHMYFGKTMEQIRPQLDQIETILYTHHQFNGTIWITEIGYHTTGPYQDLDDYDQDLYQQADSLVKVYALTLTDPYIESTVWFYLWDSEGLDQKWQTYPNFGLFYDSDYKIKPVGYAYQLLSSKLSYGFYLPSAFSMSAGLGQWLLDSENLYIYCFQTITNETIFLCWNHLAPASLELHCDQPITAFCQYSFYENIVLPFDVTTFTPTLKYTTIIDNTPRIFGIKTPDGSVAYLILTLYPTGEEIVVWGLLPILSIVGVIVCLRWIIKVKRAKKAKKL